MLPCWSELSLGRHRLRARAVREEAIIGIVYAVSAAVAILVMSKATQETEHLKEMLVGNILSVSWPELGKTAALYALVGLFHYVFRQRFLLISMDEQAAERQGLNVRFWDFLFYVSFGFVVTSSVAIAVSGSVSSSRPSSSSRSARSVCCSAEVSDRHTSLM